MSRVRLPAALLLVAAALVLAHYVQVWASVPAVGARTSDFAGTYAASTLWRTGSGSSMYDVAAQEAVSRAAGVPANHLFIPFQNPPLAAVLASPLSLLDATAAYRLWSLLQAGALVVAVLIAARAAPWPGRRPRLSAAACAGVALAGFGTGLLLVEGQWDGLPALGVALAYLGWRRGDHLAPGFAAGFAFAAAKPHLAAGVVAFMAGRRDWRGLAGAAAGAGAVALGGLVTAGPGATSGFVHALLQPENSPPAQMQGVSGLIGSLFGGGLGAYAIALLLGGVGALVAGWLGAVSRRRSGLLEPALLGATALSLWASPHLLGHDLVILAPPLVATLAWAMGHQVPPVREWPGALTLGLVAGWGALSIASDLDLGQSAVGLPGRLTPWVLLAGAVAIAVSLSAGSRGRASAAGRPGWSAPRG